jgi:hypothetical protein
MKKSYLFSMLTVIFHSSSLPSLLNNVLSSIQQTISPNGVALVDANLIFSIATPSVAFQIQTTDSFDADASKIMSKMLKMVCIKSILGLK